jgi:hypothetical protein
MTCARCPSFLLRWSDPCGSDPAFTAEFFNDESKQRQWDSFNLKNRLYIEPVPPKIAIGNIERFLMPLLIGVKSDGHWDYSWPVGGPRHA